ncbi:CAP domain-containing protein [Salibacterium sp. K-3]
MKKIIIASAVILMFPAAAQAQNCITAEKGDTWSQQSEELNVSLEQFVKENNGQFRFDWPQQETQDSEQKQTQENEQEQTQEAPEEAQQERESNGGNNSSAPEDNAANEPSNEAASEESASEEPSGQQDTADVETESEFEQQVIELTNQEREAAGLEPLQPYSELSDVARDKSEDMRDAGYFSHNSPNYGSPFDMMDSYGIDYRGAGENIAAGQRTPEQVVEGWMNSEGHRENIMNEDFTHIGVGHAEGGSHGHYWTQMFVTK